MMENATDTQLKQGFESHQKEVRIRIQRLHAILDGIAGDAEESFSKSMHALIDEGEDMVQEATHDAVRDAALIASALRIQHDEIAAYGSVCILRGFWGASRTRSFCTLPCTRSNTRRNCWK